MRTVAPSLESEVQPAETPMHQDEPLIPCDAFREWVDSVEALGVDVGPALSQIGISRRYLDTHPLPLPMRLVASFLTAVHATTGATAIGVRLAQRLVLADCLGAPDDQVVDEAHRPPEILADRLVQIVQHLRFAAGLFGLHFQIEGHYATVRLTSRRPELLHPELVEMVLAALARFSRELLGGHERYQDVAVRFAHAAPEDPRLQRAFFRVPVGFNATHSALTFPAQILQQPVSRPEPSRHPDLRASSARRPPIKEDLATVKQRVLEVLQAEIGKGNPSLERVAERLGLHPRTLTRRLHALGTSHQKVLDALRYDRSVEYLRDPTLPLRDIATALGYSTVGAFGRAFRRWSGYPPHELRARLSRADPSVPRPVLPERSPADAVPAAAPHSRNTTKNVAPPAAPPAPLSHVAAAPTAVALVPQPLPA